MTEKTQTPKATDKSALRSAAIIGVLLALFGSGLWLAKALTDDEVQQTFAARAAAGTQAATGTTQVSDRQQAAAGALPDGPETEPTRPERAGKAAETLAVLRAELDDTRARLTALAARQASTDEGLARIDALEQRLEELRAATRAIADQASAQAARGQALHREYAALDARFADDGVLVRLDTRTLGFARGSAVLSETAEPALAGLADFLTRHPAQHALLRGHTDTSGNDEANLRLSQARADAVRDSLTELGVPLSQLRSEGVGPAEPIADNGTRAGRERNRRVDVLLEPVPASPEG